MILNLFSEVQKNLTQGGYLDFGFSFRLHIVMWVRSVKTKFNFFLPDQLNLFIVIKIYLAL